MAKKKNTHYVVWNGYLPGIYYSWDECKAQIQGFKGAIYKGFPSMEEAKKALNTPPTEYIGKEKKNSRKMSDEERAAYGDPIQETLSVDAACSGNPGALEYRGVYTATGQEVFRKGPFKQGTVNIGEFLAIVHGLAWLQKEGSSMDIYTDSKTAMTWVRNKKVNTKLEVSPDNIRLFEMLDRALLWLKNSDYSNRIMKWETKVWGEIPADFGRK